MAQADSAEILHQTIMTGELAEAYFAYAVANMSNDFEISVNFLTDKDGHDRLPRCYVCDFLEARNRHFEVKHDAMFHKTGNVFLELEVGHGEESWMTRFARAISARLPVSKYMAYVNSADSSLMFIDCRKLVQYFWSYMGIDIYIHKIVMPSREEIAEKCMHFEGWDPSLSVAGNSGGFGVKVKIRELQKHVPVHVIGFDKLRVESFQEFADKINEKVFPRLNAIEGLDYAGAIERFKMTCCRMSSDKVRSMSAGTFSPRPTNGEVMQASAEEKKSEDDRAVPMAEVRVEAVPAETKDHGSEFVHLHVHSFYSLLDGVSSPDSLAARAVEMKQKAIAITDHGHMFGCYKMKNACDDAGIKAIYGFEAYYCDDVEVKERNMYHLILLASNAEGWRNVVAMCSMAGKDGFYYKPRVDERMLREHSDGVIVLSGCYKSPISFHLSEEGHDPDRARAKMRMLKGIFGDRFYNEVMCIGMKGYDSMVPRILQLAEEEGVKSVVTNDCHYAEASGVKTQEIMMKLVGGKLEFEAKELYLKSRNEMLDNSIILREHADMTLEIADRIDFQLEFKGYKFPAFDITKEKDFEQYARENNIG